MRAVIDTNVLISGFISRESYPAKLVDGWVEKRFEPVVSEEIIREYREVFARDRFSALGSVEERLKLLGTLLSFEHVVLVNPQEQICMVKDDPRDDIFLECAAAGECEFIISGDQHLLKLKQYKNIKVITAKEFIELLKASEEK
ncbi:putative toxin-antitoxin system toxin component, PIN family [Candidatus Sordicultor fermentans]|uniref:putative toxin-antitoxin system toxin component, PIN family n=1 Tax=Candidatus Sordicultor fermentans TaxID=1953203 RepID=UPI001690FB9E|nr:putative toxin-antitoxin system toxin component, PIN family [Candidatus Atribacteria bacterium]